MSPMVCSAMVHGHADEDAEMLVVAPESGVSRLEWLTNAEDDAREGAASLAVKRQRPARPTTFESAQVIPTSQAIEDVLRPFAADEILAITHPHDQADWPEARNGAKAQGRFGLPVVRVEVSADGSLAHPGG
jgi:hypothetical protein